MVENIDIITSQPPLQDPPSTLCTVLWKLCNEVSQIKTDICTALSKTSIKDVTVCLMHGKGSNKVSKEFLATNLLALVTLVDTCIDTCIDPIISAEPAVVDICAPVSGAATETNGHTAFVDSIQNRLDLTVKSSEDNVSKMADMLKQLQHVQSSIITSPPTVFDGQQPASTSCIPATAAHGHATSSCANVVENPTDNIYRYVEDFLTAEQEVDLSEFLSKEPFTDIKSRSVIDWGKIFIYMITSQPRSSNPNT